MKEFNIIATFLNDHRIYELVETINIETGLPSGFCFTRSSKVRVTTNHMKSEKRFEVFPTIREVMWNLVFERYHFDSDIEVVKKASFIEFKINGERPDDLEFLNFI